MLTKIKIPLPDMIVSPSFLSATLQLVSFSWLGLSFPNFYLHLYVQKAVLALDSSALDIDQVENLIKFCPTKEEMEMLRVIYSFIT
jgi:hypothetical protein